MLARSGMYVTDSLFMYITFVTDSSAVESFIKLSQRGRPSCTGTSRFACMFTCTYMLT